MWPSTFCGSTVPISGLCRSASVAGGCRAFCRRDPRLSPRRFPSRAGGASSSSAPPPASYLRYRRGGMRLFFLTLLLVVTLRPCAAEIIQLEGHRGTYTVPVRINGAITLPFVLDTGASAVAIPEDVFLTLTRTGTVKTSDFIGTGTVVLADGSEHASRRFVLHEVQVGSHVVRNVVASVVSVRGDPLLGQSFLSKLPAWSIDNQSHSLVLHDQAGLTAPPAQTNPAQPPPSAAYGYGGSGNPIHDRLVSLSPAEQARTLAQNVGQGCVGTAALPMGVVSTDKWKALAYWSVRCQDGRSFALQIAPDAKIFVVNCETLRAIGKECFKKF